MVHFLPVGLDTHGTAIVEGENGFRQQPGGLEEIVGNHRHEHIQLEVSLTGGDADGGVVAHHLDGHHGHCLALGGVDLAGHDGGAGLVFRDKDFAQPVPGPRGQPANVVGNFHHVRCQGLQGAVGKYQLILGGQGMEFILGGDKAQAGDFRNLLGYQGVEALRCVQPGAYGGAPQGQLPQGLHGKLD